MLAFLFLGKTWLIIASIFTKLCSSSTWAIILKLPLGSSTPSDLFNKFREDGDQDLIDIRKQITGEFETKQPRMFRLKDAAELIGCTEADIRSLNVTELNLEQINSIRDQTDTRYKRPAGSQAAIMSVVNFKGGVGKSTTCVHLAQRAALIGLRVLLIDLDPQATSTLNLGNIIPDFELNDEEMLGDALIKEPSDLKFNILTTYFPGVALIPANLLLQDADLQLSNPDLNNNERLGSPDRDRLSSQYGSVDHQCTDCQQCCHPARTTLFFRRRQLCHVRWRVG